MTHIIKIGTKETIKEKKIKDEKQIDDDVETTVVKIQCLVKGKLETLETCDIDDGKHRYVITRDRKIL